MIGIIKLDSDFIAYLQGEERQQFISNTNILSIEANKKIII